MTARTLPARASVAALLILAERSLTEHTAEHGPYAPTLRPEHKVERVALHSRRDALADAYRCIVADELGVAFMLMDLPQLRQHAEQQVAAAGAL